MRLECGTVIASTPSVERVRSMYVRSFFSSSMDATVTGEVRKSNFSTGASAIRRSCSSLTALPWLGGESFADAIPVPAIAATAAPWMNRRREAGMAGYGTASQPQGHEKPSREV
jgi:hypothetical protein